MLSYAVPDWQRQWDRALLTAGDQAVVAAGFAAPWAAFLRRCPPCPTSAEAAHETPDPADPVRPRLGVFTAPCAAAPRGPAAIVPAGRPAQAGASGHATSLRRRPRQGRGCCGRPETPQGDVEDGVRQCWSSSRATQSWPAAKGFRHPQVRCCRLRLGHRDHPVTPRRGDPAGCRVAEQSADDRWRRRSHRCSTRRSGFAPAEACSTVLARWRETSSVRATARPADCTPASNCSATRRTHRCARPGSDAEAKLSGLRGCPHVHAGCLSQRRGQFDEPGEILYLCPQRACLDRDRQRLPLGLARARRRGGWRHRRDASEAEVIHDLGGRPGHHGALQAGLIQPFEMR